MTNETKQRRNSVPVFGEELQRVGEICGLWVCGTLFVADVVNEQGAHDSIGGFLPHDPAM